MKGFRPERKLVPLRFVKADYDKVKLKLEEDHLTFQKVMEVLFLGYLNNNKHIRELVMKHSGPINDKVKLKLEEDHLTFQKVMEVLFLRISK